MLVASYKDAKKVNSSSLSARRYVKVTTKNDNVAKDEKLM